MAKPIDIYYCTERLAHTIVNNAYWENNKSMLMFFFLLLLFLFITSVNSKNWKVRSKVKQLTVLFVPTNSKRASAHVDKGFTLYVIVNVQYVF